MGSVRVIRGGLHTTVQDLGRWGFQSQGVSVCGAMDPFAHQLANLLVGNARTTATLEITLTGPELLFEDRRTVAVCGAEFDLQCDGRPVPHATPFVAAAGSIVRFGTRRRGARAYLAIAGGLDVPVVLGSRATHVGTRIGGFEGRAVAAGDRLPLGSPAPSSARPTQPGNQQRGPGLGDAAAGSVTTWRIRVLPGPQVDAFADGSLDVLQSAPYQIAPDSNRMGFRLSGPRLDHQTTADIISDPVPLGALQVPSSGQPILLMADRQTTGGYAKLATVITADIGIAAQAAPGETLSFTLCSEAEAVSALIARERTLLAVDTERP